MCLFERHLSCYTVPIVAYKMCALPKAKHCNANPGLVQCEAGKMLVEAVHSTVPLPGIMEVHSYANEEYNNKTPGCHGSIPKFYK